MRLLMGRLGKVALVLLVLTLLVVACRLGCRWRPALSACCRPGRCACWWRC
jgi:hypothetical protein